MTTFTLFFFGWIVLFSIIFQSLGIDVDTEDYPHLNKEVVYFIQIFRNSIGDLAVPGG